MHLGDLPFDLQLQVLQLCSHRVLASLSRVHSSLRDAADYSLYRHIRIYTHRYSSTQRILGTLATNPQKASFVRVLEVVIRLDDPQYPDIIARMLPNMLNLYKLRFSLKTWWNVMSGGINQAISGHYFRLRILCLEERQCHWEEIKKIIASQPDLRLLGFYRLNKNYKPLLTIAQKFHHDPSRLLPLPTIFMLDLYEGKVVEYLPSYHRPGEALEVFKEINTCFGLNYVTSPNYTFILRLDLFGISNKNIDLFSEVMEAVATCLSKKLKVLNIIVHQTSLQNLWQFPEFVKLLALFPHLITLTFKFRYVLGATGLHALSTDLRLYLADSDLERLCPRLLDITFWCKWNRHSRKRKLVLCRPQWLPLTD